MIWQSVAPPVPFADTGQENAFLLEYRSSGRAFACWAFGLGALLAIASFLIIWSDITSQPPDALSQVIRITTALGFAFAVLMLITKPVWSVERYYLTVGAPLAIGVLVIGWMALWKAVALENSYSNLPIALTLTTLLAYSMVRLSVSFVALITLTSTALLLLSKWIAEYDVFYIYLMYAAVTNITGWIVGIQIEKRERKVFNQAFALKALNATLSERVHQANKANLEKDALIQVVAHDLRQPVSSLDLQLALLQPKLNEVAPGLMPDIRPLEDCITSIRSDIERLLTDANPLRRSISVMPANLSRLLERTRQMYSVTAKQYGVELLVLHRSGEDMFAMSNEDALFNILGNLISNGAKFRRSNSARRPFVGLAVTSVGRRIRMDVLDNGVGIPSQHLPLIMEPYWSAIPATCDATDGLGLGLATVRDFVDRMPGHSLRIWSRVGVGTRVSIYLPSLSRIDG